MSDKEKSRRLVLGDRTAWLRIPQSWHVAESGLQHHEITFDNLADVSVTVRLHGFEDPKAVAAEDVSRFLIEPGHSAPRNVPTVPGCLFVTTGVPGDQRRHGDMRRASERVRPRHPGRRGDYGDYQRFYRQAEMVAPRHVRVLAATLSLPFGRRKDAFVSRLDDEVREAMSGARFATELTALDRVAPSDTLKRVSFWDVVHMRLPVGWWWNREHDDGTGMFVASDPTNEGGPSLWVDFDQFDSLDAGSTAADYADHVDGLTAQLAAAGADERKLVTERLAQYDTAIFYSYEDIRNGQQLSYDYCHRVVLRDRYLVVAHFSVIRPHGPADTEGAAAFLRREIRNAWIVPA